MVVEPAPVKAGGLKSEMGVGRPVPPPSMRPLYDCHSDAPRGIWGGALGMDYIARSLYVFQT